MPNLASLLGNFWKNWLSLSSYLRKTGGEGRICPPPFSARVKEPAVCETCTCRLKIFLMLRFNVRHKETIFNKRSILSSKVKQHQCHSALCRDTWLSWRRSLPCRAVGVTPPAAPDPSADWRRCACGAVRRWSDGRGPVRHRQTATTSTWRRHHSATSHGQQGSNFHRRSTGQLPGK